MTPAETALLPCPFCGSKPDVEPWHGGAKTKIRVGCVDETCSVQPCCTGQTEAAGRIRWNRRASPQPSAEPDAWLYQLSKPGHAVTFASVDPDDPMEWPKFQWTISYKISPLYLREQPSAVPGGHCSLFVPQNTPCAEAAYCKLAELPSAEQVRELAVAGEKETAMIKLRQPQALPVDRHFDCIRKCQAPVIFGASKTARCTLTCELWHHQAKDAAGHCQSDAPLLNDARGISQRDVPCRTHLMINCERCFPSAPQPSPD